MTEKRFRIVQGYNDRYCQDLQTNELLNQNRTVECLNALHEENTKVKSLIDEKIDYLQKKYDFGQNVYHGCPMHNIMHSINTLKEIKKKMGWE